MRILVTGSRSWTDRDRLFNVLDYWHALVGISVVIEGCAVGADEIAGWHKPDPDRSFPGGWAWHRDVPGMHFPVTKADWARLGKSAGVRRNSRMLADSEPEMVVAFDLGTSGTADMIRKARTWGLEVVVVNPAGGRYVSGQGAGWMPARGEPCTS